MIHRPILNDTPHSRQLLDILWNQRGWNFAGDKPTGAPIIDDRWVLSETLRIPANCGLIGADPMPRRGSSVLYWMGPNAGWMVTNEPSDGRNYNGNFSQRFGYLRLLCQGEAKGVSLGGGQQSEIEWLEVHDPKDKGIRIKRSSRSMTVNQCNIDGPEGNLDAELIGLEIADAKAITLGPNSYQWCATAINCDGQAVRSYGYQAMEQVGTAVKFGKRARECEIHVEVSQHDTNYPLIDFRECPNVSERNPTLGLRVTGIVEKTEGDPFYVDRNGNRQEIIYHYGDPASKEGAGFYVSA